MTRRERARRVVEILGKLYPEADCALRHRSPFQLLAATILSAQCTDVMVNKVTPALFRRYPTPRAMAAAPMADLQRLIHSTGFFRNKAKSLKGTARALVERFHNRVPRTMEEMLTLSGVARKTANVVLGTWFGIPTGITVDTHVFRVTRRLGLSKEKTPEKVERDLMALVPREKWIDLGHAVIWHGRRVCHARKPACGECPMATFCPSKHLGAGP